MNAQRDLDGQIEEVERHLDPSHPATTVMDTSRHFSGAVHQELRARRRQAVVKAVIALVAILAIPRLAGDMATRSAGWCWNWLGNIDPNGTYLWVSLHHVWQLVATLAAMLLFDRSLRHWGFNLNNWRTSLYLFGQFFLYFMAVAVAGHLLLFFFAPPPVFPHALTARNVFGELGFKLFLSGTCEEPLFRGLVMVLVYQSMRGVVRIGRIEMPYAGLVATALFMVAHIGYTLSPPAITSFSIPQQIEALVLGLFYAYIFHRTRSLLGPILVHNYVNFSLTALGMLWALLRG